MAPVNVTIRTPTKLCDLRFDCALDWSILRVKEEIEKRFESHPKPRDQRLVYAGKLLDNESLLENVLRMDDEVDSYTVHLVCRQQSFPDGGNDEEGVRKRQKAAATAATASSSNSASTTESNAAPNVPESQFVSGQYDMSSWAAMMQQQMMAMGNGSSGENQNPDQAMWMQHMYAQYMTQYMHYMQTAAATAYPQAAAATMVPPAMPHAAPPPAANLNANNNEPAVIENRNEPLPPAPQGPQGPQGAAAAAAAPPPQVMNAGAGGAMALEDDENNQRDALDWLYIASRVLVLLSIVYFYSSLTRFLVVTVCGFMAYLWNVGAFRRGAREEENNPPPPAAENRPEEERGDIGEGTNDETDGSNREEEVSEEGGDDVDTAPEVVAPQTDLMALAYTFFTTFFTSLLPEQQQVV